MLSVVILTALLICKTQSQLCGGPLFPGSWGLDPYLPCDSYGPGLLQNLGQPCAAPCGPTFNPPILSPNLNPIPPFSLFNQPCSQPLITEVPCGPAVITNPCGTTNPIVATTIVDNSVANSLANAIQLLIVSNLIENTLGSSCNGAVTQCLGIPDTCVNSFEVVTPDCYPSVVTCDCPCYDTYTTYEVPCYQEPVVYQTCVDPCNGLVSNAVEVPFVYDNCGPNIVGLDACGNAYAAPYGCAELAISPMAVEVPFPSSIPAQLLCNFGYMPSTVPCVSVNVEPLPFDGCGCNNLFGNVFY